MKEIFKIFILPPIYNVMEAIDYWGEALRVTPFKCPKNMQVVQNRPYPKF